MPVASDLLMLAPHMAAVWMAYRRRPVWSGVLAGVALLGEPQGCVRGGGVRALGSGGRGMDGGGLAGGQRRGGGVARGHGGARCLLGRGLALGEAVCRQHVCRIAAAQRRRADGQLGGVPRRRRSSAAVAGNPHGKTTAADGRDGWLLSLAGVAAGLRFFPRYYFLLLPPVVLLAARGFALWRRAGGYVAVLLLIPLARFAPSYLAALRRPRLAGYRDGPRQPRGRGVRAGQRKPGDTLFVWGYRPEIYVYTGMPAATRFLDSQPLTGVPADRHLTQSEPVETVQAARRREELARSRPQFMLDGARAC